MKSAGVILGIATLAMALIGLSAEPAGAISVPKSGVVEVTGFKETGLNGSSGPVTVVVSGRQAAALRQELMTLPQGAVPGCMEALDPFNISFLPRKGARPLLTAWTYDCPLPGELLIRGVGGSPGADLKDDCALQRMIPAILPRGRAKGTRAAILENCPPAGSVLR
jgi:hypothetical protein